MIENKVNMAIRNLRYTSHMAKKRGGILAVAYSGGKDSDVILELVKMTNRPYRVHHSLTTLDAPETIKHISEVKRKTEKDSNCVDFVLIRPELTFTQLIEKHKFPPTRNSRYCCRVLKENSSGDIGDILVLGVRADESTKRKDRKLFQIKGKDKITGDKFINCDLARFNKLYGNIDNELAINPIVYWTTNDIKDFVDKYDIKLNSVYEKQGGIETRCGCLFCPLASQKSRMYHIENYPVQWERIKKSLVKIAIERGYNEEEQYHFVVFWLLGGKNNKLLNTYIESLEESEKEKYHRALLSYLKEQRNSGKKPEIVVDSFEDFLFMQNEIAYEKAHDPRIRICSVCNKRGKVTPEIKALNLKLHGRGIHRSKLMCIDCLAEEMNTTVEHLEEMIETFKEDGCELF